MNKIIFIFIFFFPSLLFGQKDTSTATFKIGNKPNLELKPGACVAVLGGKYSKSISLSLPELLKNRLIEIKGCGDSNKVASFEIAYILNNSATTRRVTGDSIPLYLLTNPNFGGFTVIRNIDYISGGIKKRAYDCKIIIVITKS